MDARLFPLLLAAGALVAPRSSGAERASTVDEVLARVAATEANFLKEMHRYRPLVETYVQFFRDHEDGRQFVVDDAYFIGKLEFAPNLEFRSLIAEKASLSSRFSFLKRTERPKLLPRGFVQMAILDSGGFDRAHYEIENLHREFVGEVRCLVMDVKPRPKEPEGRFVGRIWVEDQGYHIVRFSGTYTSKDPLRYLHFNGYREQFGADLWLPSTIYVEQSFKKLKLPPTSLKGHVRLWSYAASARHEADTFTNILIESPDGAEDRSATEVSRTEALRGWQRQAEENTLMRMEKAGLVGPAGAMEKVLDTVLNNLIVTNKLAVDPPARTRVFLTTPFESMTVGHTILVSRGLIDVLPNEACLAVVVARELASIVQGDRVETMNAFSDRMFFDDQRIFAQFGFRRPPAQEEKANRKALELLENSPYKPQLPSVGLFLAALASKAPGLPNLLRAQAGNPVAAPDGVLLVAPLVKIAPPLAPEDVQQIAALPLFSRLRLNAWDNRTELLNTKPVAILSAAEKLPFEVTPALLLLKRLTASGAN
jgi:hypothetical protein